MGRTYDDTNFVKSCDLLNDFEVLEVLLLQL